MNNNIVIKCRKCRCTLLSYPETPLITAHGENITSTKSKVDSCATLAKDQLWYVSTDHLPPWIQESVDQVSWQKGKLTCPNCQARIGSVDFISGLKCDCGTSPIPPVQLVKSKVDHSLLGML